MFNKTIPRDGDGAGRGRVGLKSINPSPPRPVVQGYHLCRTGKTRAGRSREGQVKQGEEKLPSLLWSFFLTKENLIRGEIRGVHSSTFF